MIEKQEEEIAALKGKLEHSKDEVHDLLRELKGYYEQGVCDCCEGSVANPANPANLEEEIAKLKKQLELEQCGCCIGRCQMYEGKKASKVKYYGVTDGLTYPTIKKEVRDGKSDSKKAVPGEA